MSRQRLKSSLTSQSDTACPHCTGRGRVRTPESAALEALRKIQSAAFAGGIDEIRVRMSPVAALLLLNNKRQLLSDFERQSNTRIFIYADGRRENRTNISSSFRPALTERCRMSRSPFGYPAGRSERGSAERGSAERGSAERGSAERGSAERRVGGSWAGRP